MSEYKKTDTLSALQHALDQITSTKGSPAYDSLLELKLVEDDLYTLLYAYVRAFAPTPDLMVYTGEKHSASELKAHVRQIEQKLKTVYHLDRSSVVRHVFDLVEKKKYNEATRYIRDHVQKVEREIKILG